MSRPTRILLVGAGRMGLNHLRGIGSVPDLGVVVAGVDPSEEARHRLETEHGISSTYADLHTALDGVDADAAIIVVPNFLHAEYTLAALRSGKHVLIEKPMALTIEDVDRMVETAEAGGRLLMSGQSQRFSPCLRVVKRLIEDGAVGKIRHVVHRRLGAGRGGDETSWFAKQAQSGGILPGIGSHSLDVLLWWMDEKATTVSAVVQNIDPHPDIDIEDETSLIATTESGAILNAALSFHHTAGTEWIVMGDRAVIHLHGTRGPLLLNGKEQTVPDEVTLPGESQIHREFLTAIRDGRPLAQAAGHDVRKAMALIFAAQESGRTGKTVAVP